MALVAPPCINESSDDDVVAVVHTALPKEAIFVDKEHCMLCKQQFDDRARPRSKYSIFSMKLLHNACYSGRHSLKRTCDTDKLGNLLSRVASCRAKDPEQFKEIGLVMVDKQKHLRTTTQREMVFFNDGVNDIIVDSEAHSGRSSFDEGGIHQTLNEHEARHNGGGGDSKCGKRRAKGCRRWRDGHCRAATNHHRFGGSSREIQADSTSRGRRCSNLSEQIEAQSSKIDVYDSEFADVGGDICGQGAASSRIQVRAVELTYLILFLVIYHVLFTIVRTASPCLLSVTRNVYFTFFRCVGFEIVDASACVHL